MKLKFHSVAYHRNGVCGVGFYCGTFTCSEGGEMCFVFFPTEGDHKSDLDPEAHDHIRTTGRFTGYTAVFNREKVGKGDMDWMSNSWRGDHYEGEIRKAILRYQKKRDAEWNKATA